MSPARRRARWIVWTLLLALAAWSVGVEPRWHAQRELQAEVPGWAGARPLRVALASDWHFTSRPWWGVMGVARARAIVDEINAAQPDVVLLAGDFFGHGDFAATGVEEIAVELARLRAPLGVHAVLGNHDWWHDGPALAQALRRRGITVLENEARPLAGTGLWLAGFGDHFTDHSQPRRALAQVPAGAPVLALMHDPASLLDTPPLRGLAFAGHTHGGQVYLPFVGAPYVPSAAPRAWAYGWVRHGDNRAYVTSGLGISILPIRFNMRPEWVLFTLRPAGEGRK